MSREQQQHQLAPETLLIIFWATFTCGDDETLLALRKYRIVATSIFFNVLSLARQSANSLEAYNINQYTLSKMMNFYFGQKGGGGPFEAIIAFVKRDFSLPNLAMGGSSSSSPQLMAGLCHHTLSKYGCSLMICLLLCGCCVVQGKLIEREKKHTIGLFATSPVKTDNLG